MRAKVEWFIANGYAIGSRVILVNRRKQVLAKSDESDIG